MGFVDDVAGIRTLCQKIELGQAILDGRVRLQWEGHDVDDPDFAVKAPQEVLDEIQKRIATWTADLKGNVAKMAG